VEFYQVQKPPRQSWGQIVNKMKFIRTYNFDGTINSFTNLTKLVVRGLANDDFLKAVGTYCHRIKHLDICKSAASFKGVRFLFFKGKEAEQEYTERFKSGLPWNLPKYFLRPLTKTYEKINTCVKYYKLFWIGWDILIWQKCLTLVMIRKLEKAF
jgi:hypothetical protein